METTNSVINAKKLFKFQFDQDRGLAPNQKASSLHTNIVNTVEMKLSEVEVDLNFYYSLIALLF